MYFRKVSIAASAGEVVELPTGLGYGAGVIYNMQDMTTDICNKVSPGASGRLRDTRDGKLYWVTKLADDNCWMTQDLAFDIPAEGLKSVDSDIEEDWNATTAAKKGYAIPRATSATPYNYMPSDANIAAYSVSNGGKYIYSNPNQFLSCVTTISYAACADKGWVDVQNVSASNDPLFSGVFDYFSDDTYVYNAHYLAGNRYNWIAATAGQGVIFPNPSTREDYATDSICPKGWQLPYQNITKAAEDMERNKTFGNLLSKYGTLKPGTLQYGDQDIRLAPLYFSTSGMGLEQILNAGSWGTYATNQPTVSASAQPATSFFHFSPSGVSLPNNGYRSNTISVRCVAR